ncbi:LysR family transcriptional regulator [Ruegeria sp. SCP11]|uniref:LysR family transcriptional regulator n=1 Tax=Ruegeria sp. SCP11 TaxID=3141378 RepID=UPI0033353644
MSRDLSPLNQVSAFEATARFPSFKLATEELSFTQAAISHQIRALEKTLGIHLLVRSTRGVSLTEAAQALDAVDSVFRRFNSSEMAGTLRISVVPRYVNREFFSALNSFHSMHPDLTLELSFSYETDELQSSGFHASVRYGFGDWPGLSKQELHADRVALTRSPNLVAGRHLLLFIQEIAEMDLAFGRGNEATEATGLQRLVESSTALAFKTYCARR